MKLNTQIKLLCGSVLLASSMSAYALPKLQLDILSADAWYVGGTEQTTMTKDATFQLQAYGLNGAIDTTVDYYLSVALTPESGAVNNPIEFGDKVLLEGISLKDLGYLATYGIPPTAVVNNELGTHSIYETSYYEIKFNFNDLLPLVAAYDVETDAPQQGELMYAKYFNFDTSALAKNYGVHFDLYTYDSKGVLGQDKAPFSHDAEYLAGGDPKCDPAKENCFPTVSEPSTLLLMGAGLAALGLRKRFKK